MGNKITKAIVLWQIDRGILSSEEQEIYLYSYEIFFWQLVNFLLSLILAAVFGEMTAVLCFLLYFISLRKYAGGYHANDYLSCTVISAVETGLFCVAFRYREISILSNISRSIDMIAVFLIWFLAPIDHANKCLSKEQIRLYRKISRFILIIGVLMELLFFFTKLPYGLSIRFSHIFLSISLMVEKRKKRQKYKY